MYKFPKTERLCSKIEIAKLFSSKDGFLNYPLSVKFHVNESQSPKVKLVIVSPKKYQRLSISRNRIKRLIREAYRLNSQEIKDFSSGNKINIYFAFSFVSQQMVEFDKINIVVSKSLTRIINELKQRIENNNQIDK
ncbi:MAG: ribonuclease P protein component [Bacteroidales bacterium]